MANPPRQEHESVGTNAWTTPRARGSVDVNGVRQQHRPQARWWMAFVLAFSVALAAVVGVFMFTITDGGSVVMHEQCGVLQRVGHPWCGARVKHSRRGCDKEVKCIVAPLAVCAMCFSSLSRFLTCRLLVSVSSCVSMFHLGCAVVYVLPQRSNVSLFTQVVDLLPYVIAARK